MTCRYPDLGSASDWSSRPRKFASANSILMSEMAHVPYYQWFFFLSSKNITILGDPGAVSRVGKCRGRKFASTGKRAPGYGLSPIYFQKFKQMPAPDWAQKMLGIIVPNGRTVSPEFDRSPETGGFEVCMARIWFRARAVPVDTVLNKGNFTTKCGINKIICNTACCAMYLETSTHLRLKAQSRIWGQYSDFHKKKLRFAKIKPRFSKKQTPIFKETNSDFQNNKLRFSKKQTPIFKKSNSDFQKNKLRFSKKLAPIFKNTNSHFQRNRLRFSKNKLLFSKKQTPIFQKTSSDSQNNKLRFSKNKLRLWKNKLRFSKSKLRFSIKQTPIFKRQTLN